MSVINNTEKLNKEEIMDDISEKEDNNLNQDKLAKLKAKLAAKENKEMSIKNAVEKEVSAKLGIIGLGQAGSKIAVEFYKRNYSTIVINTALADLKNLEIPDVFKLLISNGLHGAGRELSIGRECAESHKDEIIDMINKHLLDSQINVVICGLGGGTGSGSISSVVGYLSELRKPIIAIVALPMQSDDAKSKSNSLETLAELAELTKNKNINSIILIDNAKIENIYSNTSQFSFYDTANRSIAETLDIFNTLSAKPSSIKGLDQTELLRILIDGNGLCTYGSINVEEYNEDISLAEAVLSNLDTNLLADLDIKNSKYVGVIFAANKSVWEKIPSSSVNYALSVIGEKVGAAVAIFKGIYETEDPEDIMRIHTIVSGLGLPMKRIEEMKDEVNKFSQVLKIKEENRNLTLTLDNKDTTISSVQKIRDKIANKSSSFSKFTSSITDKRK